MNEMNWKKVPINGDSRPKDERPVKVKVIRVEPVTLGEILKYTVRRPDLSEVRRELAHA